MPLLLLNAAVASVMSDSVRPQRRQPTRLPRPWDSPGKNTGVGCHFLLHCMKVKSLSHVWLLVTPWTAAYQAPLSMGFTRQECLNTYVQLTLEYMLENTIFPPRIVRCISGATFLHLTIRIKSVAFETENSST